MRFKLKYYICFLIYFFVSCYYLVKPPKFIEAPKITVAVLWDIDTIYLTSAKPYSVISRGKAIALDANQQLLVIYSRDTIFVYKSPKQKLLASGEKIIFESPEKISIGKDQRNLTAYHRRIIISKDIAHRFPTKYHLTAINILPLEQYLYGVVSCEIGIANEQELEAVKAQAVCARSYAMSLLGKKKDFDVYGSYLYDQEYQGADREYSLAIRGVHATTGEVMTYHDEVILAQYHACCGGRTTDGRFSYLRAIVDAPYHSSRAKPYCHKAPYFQWVEKFSLKDFQDSILKLAGIKYKFTFDIKLDINKRTKRVEHLKFIADKEYKLTGETIRKAFNLKSTFFNIQTTKDSVIINGHGWGHGIGLCQYGALEMARQKISYKNILKHYYHNIKIAKIY
ncbi:MAG: SpoIID/LytB domain-containing protein [candidate division WOR-3 bacterium]